MPTIDIGDQEIHYREQGSGDALVVFPDNLHSSQGYLEEMEYFSDRFHVLSFDYPGTGRSTRDDRYPDERAVDPWGFRADLSCHLLLELGIAGAWAMGAGEGALVALHFAGRQARLHGLAATGVIADSFLCSLDRRTLHRSLDVREHTYVRNQKSLRQQHGEDWREVVDADTSFLRGLADRGGYELPGFILRSIPCRTLLTGNLSDALTPHIAEEFARLSASIPDCSVYLASTAAHQHAHEHPLMKTDPETFRAVTDLFLARTARTGEKRGGAWQP